MSSEQGSVNILPIPPALEFPYPKHSVGSSQAATTNQDDPLAQSSPETTTPGLLDKAGFQQPRPPGPRQSATTGRPSPIKQSPRVGVERRATGEPSNKLAQALFHSDSESTSSSEDEAATELPAKPDAKKKRTQKSDFKGQSDDPYRKFAVGNQGYRTRGHVSKRDGRLNISLQETGGKGYLAKTLGATLLHRNSQGGTGGQLSPLREDAPGFSRTATASSALSTTPSVQDSRQIPRLRIVIMVIGSRGDIQPFLRLGKILKEEHGHRVRIATHPVFKEFVEKDSQLEFFSIGGDPSELMSFMVKNPGLLPKPETVRQGEIAKKRESMFEMFQGFWRACINTTDDEHDVANLKMMGAKNPFVADAIIANPPSFAHVHCAERLGIPLHLMFTFPTSPTQQFPHPLTNIKQSNVDANYTNFMSYPLVEMMTWQGLGDLINKFRVKTLGLEPVSTLWAPGQLFRQRVPYSYLWSPGLIPKPADWGPEIDITGFVFLDLASSFKPAAELTKFLEAGEPPLYIGFGSIVVDDPEKFTSLIFEAVKKAGVRALVSKGWGGLGDDDNTPEGIYMLGNTPHDWLFPRVSAVVHHGGAGSTAIGLKCGKPTMIVPFFGDQPFWGAMVSKSGAGAEPVPYKRLTADILAKSITQLLTPEKQQAAQELSRRIEDEGDGALNAVKSFHRSLPLRGNHSLRCSILDDQVAVWWLKGRHVRLSALAAEILVSKKKVQWSELRLVRHYDWADFEGPGEPLTGAGGAILGSVGKAFKGIGSTPFRWATSIKRRERYDRRRREVRRTMDASKGEVTESQAKGKIREHEADASKKHDELAAAKNDETRGGTTSKPTLPLGNMNDQMKPNSHSDKPIVNGKPNPVSLQPDTTTGLATEPGVMDLPPGVEAGDEAIAKNLATGTGIGLAKTGKAIVNFPMDLSLALAQGFHNAPRLYGDETVRTPTRINGMKSGLRAAGENFSYGVYDGWTGVIAQPIDGARKQGVGGFAKGVGKGLGGFVLKDLSAIFGLPAYTLKGLNKELGKSKQPTRFIRRARILQGQEEASKLSPEELEQVVDVVSKGWKVVALVEGEIGDLKKTGVKGRWAFYKGMRVWKEHEVFENVEQTGRALEVQKKGLDFEEEFKRHKTEVGKQLAPRKSTMDPNVNADDKKDSRKSAESSTRVLKVTPDKTSEKSTTEIAGTLTGRAVMEGAAPADKAPLEYPKHHASDPSTGLVDVRAKQTQNEIDKREPGSHAGNGMLKPVLSA